MGSLKYTEQLDQVLFAVADILPWESTRLRKIPKIVIETDQETITWFSNQIIKSAEEKGLTIIAFDGHNPSKNPKFHKYISHHGEITLKLEDATNRI